MTKPEREDLYQMITDKVIAALEKGVIPWQKPWIATGGQMNQNLITRKPYRGVNQFILALSGFSSPYWLSAKQVADRKGTIKEGAKPEYVVFFRPMMIKVKNPKTNLMENKVIPFLRHSLVYNLEQTEGVKLPKPVVAIQEAVEKGKKNHKPIKACEKIVKGYKKGPAVEHGHDRAAYAPLTDNVMMPDMGMFHDPEGYYATLFHELSHSTGHKSRLNRPELTKLAAFGDESYSKEELVAEMSSAMLCAVADIDVKVIDNTQAYINNWLSKLQNDKKLLVSAAAKAQKSADHILGVKA